MLRGLHYVDSLLSSGPFRSSLVSSRLSLACFKIHVPDRRHLQNVDLLAVPPAEHPGYKRKKGGPPLELSRPPYRLRFSRPWLV